MHGHSLLLYPWETPQINYNVFRIFSWSRGRAPDLLKCIIQYIVRGTDTKVYTWEFSLPTLIPSHPVPFPRLGPSCHLWDVWGNHLFWEDVVQEMKLTAQSESRLLISERRPNSIFPAPVSVTHGSPGTELTWLCGSIRSTISVLDRKVSLCPETLRNIWTFQRLISTEQGQYHRGSLSQLDLLMDHPRLSLGTEGQMPSWSISPGCEG